MLTGAVLASALVFTGAGGASVSVSLGPVYALDSRSVEGQVKSHLVELDALTLSETGRLELVDPPASFAFSPDRRRLALAGKWLTIVDLERLEVQREVPLVREYDRLRWPSASQVVGYGKTLEGSSRERAFM